MTTMTAERPASEAQARYLVSLLGSREVAADTAARWRALVDGGQLTARQASQGITWLKAQPERRGTGPREPAACGLYRHDGRLFVVREFTPEGEDRKVRFAKELVPTTGGQADRAGVDGQARKLRSVRAPGMQWRLTRADAVTIEDARALGIEFGECLLCGLPIETRESVARGIGPVCARKQAALLDGAA